MITSAVTSSVLPTLDVSRKVELGEETHSFKGEEKRENLVKNDMQERGVSSSLQSSTAQYCDTCCR